ncbi:unnamed protein product [Symbiodinium sp. CCMP2592]|nr:unnamed protein product [Symbiodinium sp. CCMP2592]
MFARVQSGGLIAKIVGGVGITASGAAACFGGGQLLLQAGQYLREAEDRRRSVDRLVKSAFFAEPPIVEIPRKATEAQLLSMLRAKDHSPILVWGNHQAGKSRLLWKVLHSMSLDQGVLHLHMTRDEDRAETMLCTHLGVQTDVEAMETLHQAAAALGRLPVIVVEVPRQIRNEAALQSCSTFAKKFAYDAQLADVVVLAGAAATALAFGADSREKRVFLAPLSEQECQQQEVQEFLKHHGGDAAVEHKADLLQLTGGNVGKLEEVAKKLKIQTFEQVRQEAIGEQGKQILRFLGIDMQGGFGPEKVKAAKEVARRDAPFHQCVRAEEFEARFTSKDLAQAVKARGAHCIYVKATTKAEERFCAASPSVHALLKRKTRWLGIF